MSVPLPPLSVERQKFVDELRESYQLSYFAGLISAMSRTDRIRHAIDSANSSERPESREWFIHVITLLSYNLAGVRWGMGTNVIRKAFGLKRPA